MDITKTFSSISQYLEDSISSKNSKLPNINTDMSKQNPVFTDLMIILICFYGVLYSSQISSIFTCQQIKLDKSNKLYQYMFTFGIFYFIILLANKSEVDLPPLQKFFSCIIYFIMKPTCINFKSFIFLLRVN